MNRPIIPYSLQMAAALVGKNEGAANRITTTAIDSVASQLIAVANSYDPSDLPFVVATMRIVAESLSGVMSDSGRHICDSIVKNTTAVAISSQALREAFENGRSEE